ncbi:MAG: hypothetical protein UY80_C0002G0006 [Parcubacteria group bacterium GW2011_GWB1_53_43]|nr:MAG: hypothetical protein UY80_C0002G0006 [Parcubacteria group bacterium GW2011_GWB1_53_43]
MNSNEGRYRIIVDRNLCISCRSCVDATPKIFELDGELKAVVKEGAEIELVTLLAAAQSCAVGAITVIDTLTGETLWPLVP